ncbi:ATP-binding protein [Palleronia sp. LCG004]|uniref:ATP-binding protein n=1 Tax=Palleronia sp. LCG004 TaxID=3079304 RepID=UPI002941DB29|nr:ATP-binding protein [Palleronia sp. LCG004]WOI56355.1 ATP-binding protein [Palleronia sp. LCG004]
MRTDLSTGEKKQTREAERRDVICESWRNELRVIFPSNPMAVRDALRSTLGGLQHLRLSEDECSTVELVLAEVMNNICEHAYPDDAAGMIELHVTHDPDGLFCVALDDGLAMPDCAMPYPDPPPPIEDAAEGGFGWFLIRELSHDLAYLRVGERNRLSFRIDVGRKVQSC